MIAMLQKKWKNLPAALRTVLTLLAVLALAALLATVRHNASAYRTGVWDTGSQTLIYGRMHQMGQGQRAPGGFLGVYTEDGRIPPPMRRSSAPTPTSPACRAGRWAG